MRHFEQLFELSVDLLCVAGTDGYFRRINPAFERVLGYTVDELKALPFMDFVHPEDRGITLAELQKLAAGHTTLRFENRYRCKDGSYKLLAWNAVPNVEENLIYAVGRDITEIRRELARFMNHLPGLVHRCRNDAKRTIEFVSDGCRELTGYQVETLLAGFEYEELIHPEDRERVRQEVHRGIVQKREFETEYRIRTAQGAEKLVWERGRVVGVGSDATLQSFVTDVTERRKLKSELNQLQRIESLGQLTGGIAHDFNNLLTVVIGNLELLESCLADRADLRELVTDASESAWRGAELSKRLLAFSRRQMLSPQVVDVKALIQGMESLFRRTISGAISIKFRLNDLPPVFMDPGELENAILNLAINARDAMPDGGTLIISTERFIADIDYAERHVDVKAGEYVVIEVSDTGVGMQPEVCERVWEPFFTTKERGKGTGLGLSTVYGLLKQSGGHVRLYSEVGHGTSVKLFIPMYLGREDAQPAPLKSEPLVGGSETILVVEDDAAVRKIVVAMLLELGYRVLEADSAPNALALLSEKGDTADLLFTDIVMPGGMSGKQLATEATTLHPRLGVLLTSGFSQDHSSVGSEFRLLRKPYRKVELSDAIRQTLEENAQRALRRSA